MNRGIIIGGLTTLLLGGYFLAVSASPINYSLAVIGTYPMSSICQANSSRMSA